MSLEGRLASFTLEEILQLIALQQKTGVLHVHAAHSMVLYFDGGALVGYRDRREGDEDGDPLRSFLKRYGYFTSENWEHVRFVQEHSRLDLTEILVNEKLCTPEELERIEESTAQEHILQGMQLKDGRYRFLSGREKLVGLQAKVRLKVEGILMEAVRRIDEVPGLEERFGQPLTKVRRTDVEVDVETIPQAMRHLLDLCRSDPTTEHVVSHGRMSRFDTLQTLDMMREEGWITVHVPANATSEDAVRAEQAALRTTKAPEIGRPLGVALALVIVALAVFWFDPLSGYRTMDARSAERFEEFALTRDLARVQAALYLYRQNEERYPQGLATLVEQDLLSETVQTRVIERVRYEALNGGDGYRFVGNPAAPNAD